MWTIILRVTSEENITMKDIHITSYYVLKTLGIGWAAFGLSLIFNVLYYALHPSKVDPTPYATPYTPDKN